MKILSGTAYFPSTLTMRHFMKPLQLLIYILSKTVNTFRVCLLKELKIILQFYHHFLDLIYKSHDSYFFVVVS